MSDLDAGLVIRDVTVRQVAVPLRRPLATRVGDFARWPLLLIDIRTEQGITGRGYLGPYLDTAAASVRTMVTELGEALSGHLAAPAAAYRAARGWLGLAGYQGLALAAVAGLDIALWDALAQAAGLPLARLLGGTGEPVPAYNSNGLGLIDPDRAGDEALELMAEGGFTALKVRVGRPARPPIWPRSARSGPRSAMASPWSPTTTRAWTWARRCSAATRWTARAWPGSRSRCAMTTWPHMPGWPETSLPRSCWARTSTARGPCWPRSRPAPATWSCRT